MQVLALDSEGRNFLLRAGGPSARLLPPNRMYREPAHFSKFSGRSSPNWSLFYDNHLNPPTSPKFKRSSHNR